MLVDEGLELLDEDACLDLLRQVPVGRVAVTIGALPAVFPVNFRLIGRDIVFRTGTGTKLDRALCNAVVAFEADQFDEAEHSGWSVLALGRATEADDQGDGIEVWAGGARDRYVRIPIDMVSGRRLARDL